MKKEPSWREIGEACGVTASALMNLRRNRKDAPRDRDIAKWKAFMETLRPRPPDQTEDASGDYHAERIRLTRAQARKIELANAVKEGTLILRADSDARRRKFAAWFTSYIRRKLENEMPARAPGMTHAQARVYGKEMVDEILKFCENEDKE